MNFSEIRGKGSQVSRIVEHLERVRAIPPHPGVALGEVPTFPSPPTLANVPRSEHPWWLLKAYRGAVAEWTGKPCYVLGKSNPATHPRWSKLLFSAAAALVEHNISPARWAYWSLLCWSYERGEESTPPLAYVWNKTRIKKQRGWFRTDCPELGGEPLKCAHISELGKMWADARDFVSSIDPNVPLLDIQKGVTKVVCMSRFQACLELAKYELESSCADLQFKANSGAWIWKISSKSRRKLVEKGK